MPIYYFIVQALAATSPDTTATAEVSAAVVATTPAPVAVARTQAPAAVATEVTLDPSAYAAATTSKAPSKAHPPAPPPHATSAAASSAAASSAAAARQQRWPAMPTAPAPAPPPPRAHTERRERAQAKPAAPPSAEAAKDTDICKSVLRSLKGTMRCVFLAIVPPQVRIRCAWPPQARIFREAN